MSITSRSSTCPNSRSEGGSLSDRDDPGAGEQPEDIGFAALRTAWNVTWSFAINSRSYKKKEANALLKYLTSPQVERIIGRSAGSPVRRSTYNKDAERYGWYSAHLHMIENCARPLPMMDHAGEVLGVLYGKINKQSFSSRIDG
ncbi:hypothetical protein [Paenibacillus motobuensis]|uniref:Extracellular solute-binding protein n=1 Tax=Paenibacillus motobuensis TaxID=295324 RepID=A0ABN0YS35_9BACL